MAHISVGGVVSNRTLTRVLVLVTEPQALLTTTEYSPLSARLSLRWCGWNRCAGDGRRAEEPLVTQRRRPADLHEELRTNAFGNGPVGGNAVMSGGSQRPQKFVPHGVGWVMNTMVDPPSGQRPWLMSLVCWPNLTQSMTLVPSGRKA